MAQGSNPSLSAISRWFLDAKFRSRKAADGLNIHCLAQAIEFLKITPTLMPSISQSIEWFECALCRSPAPNTDGR
jgi:hypothetical protein